MSNEAKILITEQGAKQTQVALDQTGQAAKRMGADVNAGATEGAKGNEKVKTSADEATKSTGLLGKAGAGLLKGFAILSTISKMVDDLNGRLKETIRLREDALKSSLTPLELGQQMLVQTGTGSQQGWAKKILQMQQSAGFATPQAASELLTAMDVEFTSQGGVSNSKVMDMAEQIAPDLAAMNLKPEQVSAIIKFAGTAGAKSDADSYRTFLAKIQKGFTTAKSTDMSSFISGLQKGGTGYLSQGGSIDAAIANYSGALSVSANENLGSTLFEQASRLAGGGYEKPRQAVEEAYGVTFSDLSMDQRYNLMVGYASSLPESQRMQFLIEAGVPAEVASGFNKLSTSTSRQATMKTYSAVRSAKADFIKNQTAENKKSLLYKVNRQDASSESDKLIDTESDEAFQIAMRKAEQIYEDRARKGDTKWGTTKEAETYEIYSEQLAKIGGYERSGWDKFMETPGFASKIPIIGPIEEWNIKTRAEGNYMDKAPDWYPSKNNNAPSGNTVQINYNYDRSRSSNTGYTQDE